MVDICQIKKRLRLNLRNADWGAGFYRLTALSRNIFPLGVIRWVTLVLDNIRQSAYNDICTENYFRNGC